MTRPIFLTENEKESLLKEITKKLRRKMFDGQLNINYTYHYDEKRPKARIVYTKDAWDKMKALILGFETEVGWHGIVERYEDDHSFLVKDIIVYPQRIAAATVQTDDEPYHKFIMEAFDKNLCINFHGHSHVNFSVSPSGVDDKDRESKMENQREGFYIFTIQNKKGDVNYWVYDYDNNIVYEKDDVIQEILHKEDSIWQFVENAKKVAVKTSSQVPAKPSTIDNIVYTKTEEKQKPKKKKYNYDPFWDDEEEDYTGGSYLPGYYPFPM